MKTSLAVILTVMAFGAPALAQDQCADLFKAAPGEAQIAREKAEREVEGQVRRFESYPRWLLRHSTNYDQILLLSELASVSGRTQDEIAHLIESVPSMTFRHATSYPTRVRIATLAAVSGKSVTETIEMMSSVPENVRNYRTSPETYSQIVELAAMTGKSTADITTTIERIPDSTFGRRTEWSLRLWLAKIALLANHVNYTETEALIRRVPRSIFNYRMAPENLSAIVELAAVTGVSPVDIVKVIESVPNATWGHTTSFENRMWIAKLALLSGKTPVEIETIGYSFPRFILRSATTADQKRFIMSLLAVGQNRKAWGLIDRPTPPEREVGFWEALARYLFE